MVSSSGSQFDLTVQNTASSLVRAQGHDHRGGRSSSRSCCVYQGWTYYVFRRRLQLSPSRPPVPGPAGVAGAPRRPGRGTLNRR